MVIHEKIVVHPTTKDIALFILGPARIDDHTYCPPAEGYAAAISPRVSARQTLIAEVKMRP
jgi:hypothetical protein